MFFRLLLESFRRQRRRKLLAGLALFLGTTAVTAMLAIATTIGDRIHKELAVYGANIVVTPISQSLAINLGGTDIHPATANAYLHESDLAKLKTIFWANNITGISPEFDLPAGGKLIAEGQFRPLPVQAAAFWFNHQFGNMKTGVEKLHPWWRVEGQFPDGKVDGGTPVLIGARLAKQINRGVGDWLGYIPPAGITQTTSYGRASGLRVVGILHTGDSNEDKLIMPLGIFVADGDALTRIEISARTKPEDAFARQDPATLSPAQREIWYCRPYANSIAFQIREAIPNADARQLRQVEQTEGKVLSRISGLMGLIAAAALLAAGFAVSSATATAVLERRAEIGLMRSLGASRSAISILFYAETAILALLGGTLGYLAGSTLAALLGARIFPADAAPTLATTFNPVLLPVIVGLAILVALLGSTPSIRSALREDPSTVLRSNA